MRRVVWPTFPVLLRYFVSVVGGLAIAIIFIGGVDYVFVHSLAYIIK